MYHVIFSRRNGRRSVIVLPETLSPAPCEETLDAGFLDLPHNAVWPTPSAHPRTSDGALTLRLKLSFTDFRCGLVASNVRSVCCKDMNHD